MMHLDPAIPLGPCTLWGVRWVCFDDHAFYVEGA